MKNKTSQKFGILVLCIFFSCISCREKNKISDEQFAKRKIDTLEIRRQWWIDEWQQKHKLSDTKTEGDFIVQIGGKNFYDVSDSALNDTLLKYILANLHLQVTEPLSDKQIDSILLLKPYQYKKTKITDLIWNEEVFLLTSDILPYIEYPDHFSQNAYHLMLPILGISYPTGVEKSDYLEILSKLDPKGFLKIIQENITLDNEKAELLILLCLKQGTEFNQTEEFQIYSNYLDSLLTYSEQLTHTEKAQWFIGLAKVNAGNNFEVDKRHSIIALEKAMQLLRGGDILFLKPLTLEISYLDRINQRYSRERAIELLSHYIPQSINFKRPQTLTCKLYTHLALIQSKLMSNSQFDGYDISSLGYFCILQPLAQSIKIGKEISMDKFDILRQYRSLSNFYRLKKDYINALKFEIEGFLILNQDTSKDFERLEWITQVNRIKYCTSILKIQSINPLKFHFLGKNSKVQNFLMLHSDVLDEVPPELELYKLIDTNLLSPPQPFMIQDNSLPQDIKIYRKHFFKKISDFYARKNEWKYAYYARTWSDSILLNDIPRQAFILGAHSYKSMNQMDLISKVAEVKSATEMSKVRQNNFVLTLVIGGIVFILFIIFFGGWFRIRSLNRKIAKSELSAKILSQTNNQLSHFAKNIPIDISIQLTNLKKKITVDAPTRLLRLADFFDAFYAYTLIPEKDIIEEIRLCKVLVDLEFTDVINGLKASERIIIKTENVKLLSTLPKLVLFNILYNSFRHGKIATKGVNGKVFIENSVIDNTYYISIRDTGVFTKNHIKGTGTGHSWSLSRLTGDDLNLANWHAGARLDNKPGFEVSFTIKLIHRYETI